MQRRSFIALAAAALAVPQPGAAFESMAYRPGLLGELQDSGRPVVLHFRASWSYTCQRKQDLLHDIAAGHPDLARRVLLVDVDWDIWGKSDLADVLSVSRQSTLVALRGEEERDRVVAEPYLHRLRALFETAAAD